MQKTIEVVGIPDELLNLLDERATQTGVDRSSYVRRLIERDLAPEDVDRLQENGRESGAASLRSLEQEWVKQHQAEYAGAWVALEGESLVAHGASARQVLDAAKAAGYNQPLIVHIPGEPQLPFGGW